MRESLHAQARRPAAAVQRRLGGVRHPRGRRGWTRSSPPHSCARRCRPCPPHLVEMARVVAARRPLRDRRGPPRRRTSAPGARPSRSSRRTDAGAGSSRAALAETSARQIVDRSRSSRAATGWMRRHDRATRDLVGLAAPRSLGRHARSASRPARRSWPEVESAGVAQTHQRRSTGARTSVELPAQCRARSDRSRWSGTAVAALRRALAVARRRVIKVGLTGGIGVGQERGRRGCWPSTGPS